jgi:hypothetical protein
METCEKEVRAELRKEGTYKIFEIAESVGVSLDKRYIGKSISEEHSHAIDQLVAACKANPDKGYRLKFAVGLGDDPRPL